ncbi:hypothetical protein [Arthrobacter sp. Y-9]|uniref:hypothetical protein n=1 Tax=Arthrobacter sp. Y-9 TaxID=3039385 RepID=UPI00241D1DC2|nr:hypothetical protein [Arthrobacter sp. Y-9]WFR85271.1 hypothetical protein P9849_06535 [Arthrobacter sp. Y-9]
MTPGEDNVSGSRSSEEPPPEEPRDSGDSGQDDDAVWEDLVARLKATDSGDTPAPQTPGTGSGFSAFDPLGLSSPAAPPSAGGGPRDYVTDPDVEEELDSFVPEDPGPLSEADPRLTLAWAGAAGGPLLIVLLLIFWRSAPQPVWWVLIAGFVAGIGYLLWQLPHRSDDDYDDGARL